MEFKLPSVSTPSGPQSNWRLVAGVVGAMILVALGGGYYLAARQNAPTQTQTTTPQPTPAPASSPTKSDQKTPAPSSSTKPNPPSTGGSTSGGNSSPSTTGTASVKTIDQGTGATQLTAKTSNYCKYAAPDDWAATSDNSGTGIDILKADKSMYAGWTISPIDRSMESYYGARYSDPETSNLSLIDTLLAGGGYTTDAQYTAESTTIEGGYFNVRPWKSSQKTGVIIYHIYPNPDVSRAYIDSTYIAATDTDTWKSQGGTAVSVAISIRCTAQLRPSADAGSGSAGDSGSESKLSKSNYNKELGTETVHDPKTGENFTVDYATQYNASGPSGGGYYRHVGNETRKLDTGLSY